MKKILGGLLTILLFSCGAKQTISEKERPLYEILTQQNDGGASIRFYEILTESREIAMLQNDENLRDKIKPGDINTSNFIILNMGEKPSAGYSITVENVEETADKVIVTVKEQEPKGMSASVITYPYCIVRINSKKQIVIK